MTTVSGDKLLKIDTVVMLKNFKDVWLILNPTTEIPTLNARAHIELLSIESIITALSSHPKQTKFIIKAIIDLKAKNYTGFKSGWFKYTALAIV